MSELPRTDELPRSEDGSEAARVEEAFAAFAERVHELESVAGELRAELRALRSERREQERRGPEPYDEDEEWPADGEPLHAGLAPSPDWVSSVPAPLTRPVVVPRLALEAIFLVLVALFAGLADLSTISIVIVMTAAWALVALSEWAAATKRAHWHLDAVAAPAETPGDAASESTGPWSIPVVEATAVQRLDHSESHTVVTKLPPQAETQPEAAEPPAAENAEAPDEPPIPPAEAEPEPKRRRGFLRRRRGADEPVAEAPDPWET